MKLKQNSIKTKKIKYYNIFLFFSLCIVSCLISITQVFAEGEGGSNGNNGSGSNSGSSNNNTVSSTSSANASVTVSSACSFTRTNSYDAQTGYTGILANNASIEITGSTFKTLCNDPGGYAIYAIGYSNNEYGNTDLIYNNEPTSTYNIKTNGDTSGNSSWKMKLSPIENNFTPTIENGYNNFNNIPSTYTKVASYNNVTVNSSDSTTGSNVTTYYKATASSTQPAGTYTGAVKYTMVHPMTTIAPYYMQEVAEWKNVLTNDGDTLQAIDKRDGKTYWVTKLKDGNIWMTQNLDLDLSTNVALTSLDTDLNVVYDSNANLYNEYNDGYDKENELILWTPKNSTIYNRSEWGRIGNYPNSLDVGLIYADNNIGDHGLIGNYYNWTAAIASNNSNALVSSTYDDISNNPKNSICPKGWRLPTIANQNKNETGNNDFANLNFYYNNGGGSSNTWLQSPLYFIKSGAASDGPETQRGYYWSNTLFNRYNSYILFFDNVIYPYNYMSSRDVGHSLRCLAR